MRPTVLDRIKLAWLADERSMLDGAPTWSPRARIVAAATMVAAYPVAVAAATIAATGDGGGTLVVVILLSVAAMAVARYVVRSDRRTRVIDIDAQLLDEREQSVRTTALAAAYRASHLLTLTIAVLAYFSLRVGGAFHAVAVYALLGAAIFVIPSLPAICHIARNRNEPPEP